MSFALVQWPWVLRALLLLSFTTALADAGLAVARRESASAPTLTYWDEAAVMLLVFLIVKVAVEHT